MQNNSQQPSLPFLSPNQSFPKLPIDTIYKTPIKSNLSFMENHKKHQIFPYTMSTSDQSSFHSCIHYKQNTTNSSITSKKLISLRRKMLSKLYTLNIKQLSKEHSQSQKHLVNKFLDSRRNVPLVQTPLYNSKYPINNSISEKSDFRNHLIRDYTGEGNFVNVDQKINRAKEYYYKQIELIQKSKSAKQKEMKKIIEELDSRKVNNLLTNITTIKEVIEMNKKKPKRPIDYNKLENIAINSLQTHYNNKINYKQKIARQITEEIKCMDAKPYKKLFDKHGYPLKKGILFNETNLERKIKLHNITHSFFDPHDDELCERSPEKLKRNMISINLGISKHLKGYCPPFVKRTFKNVTLSKYAGLNGVYFSMS